MQWIDRCRSCGSDRLEVVLDLGEQPLANALVDVADAGSGEARYPLTLALCSHCALAQILQTVPPEQLFSNYVYFSSYSDTMLAHAKESAAELVASEKLGPKSLVVEIASNDGYQLQYFRDAGVPVLGIEPAANVAAVAEDKGIPTRVEFFGLDLASKLAAEGLRADVILGFNVMAHVPDLNGFAAGLRTLMKPSGVAVIEVPYVLPLLEGREFDTIYHEHLSYFALHALEHLFGRHGLEVFRVVELPIHGGSLRVYVAPLGSRELEASVPALLARERECGLVTGAAYRDFSRRVEGLRDEVSTLIRRLRAEGARIAAYGAAAKGSTLLNYFGIDAKSIEFVADRSPHKHGKRMPGVGIPIRPAEELASAQPDYCLLLVWNFAEEILEQQRAYREAGGRFILPLPEPRVL